MQVIQIKGMREILMCNRHTRIKLMLNVLCFMSVQLISGQWIQLSK